MTWGFVCAWASQRSIPLLRIQTNRAPGERLGNEAGAHPPDTSHRDSISRRSRWRYAAFPSFAWRFFFASFLAMDFRSLSSARPTSSTEASAAASSSWGITDV